MRRVVLIVAVVLAVFAGTAGASCDCPSGQYCTDEGKCRPLPTPPSPPPMPPPRS